MYYLLGNLDSYAHPEKTYISHEEVFELPTYHNPGARLVVTVLREAWPTIALKNHFHFGSFSLSEAALPPQKRVLATQNFLNIPPTVTQVRVRWSMCCVGHVQPSLLFS